MTERGIIDPDIAAVTQQGKHFTAGPFTSACVRDVLHYRTAAVRLAKQCIDDGTVADHESLVGLAGVIWDFVENGVTGPTGTELAYAKALRATQELLVKLGERRD